LGAKSKQGTGIYMTSIWQVLLKELPYQIFDTFSIVLRLLFEKNRRTIEYQSNINRISSMPETWETLGKHLGNTWETLGKHLGKRWLLLACNSRAASSLPPKPALLAIET